MMNEDLIMKLFLKTKKTAVTRIFPFSSGQRIAAPQLSLRYIFSWICSLIHQSKQMFPIIMSCLKILVQTSMTGVWPRV